MSTRCQLAIYSGSMEVEGERRGDYEEYEVLLYKHHDGYPEGVLPDLLPFVSKFIEGRGYDTEYMGARLLQNMTNISDKDLEESVLTDKTGFNFTGYGISRWFHGDIEYLYCIYEDGIVVHSVPFDLFSGKEIGLLPVVDIFLYKEE